MVKEGLVPPGTEGPADAVRKMNDDHELRLGRGWKQSSISYLAPRDVPWYKESEHRRRLSETEKYGQEAFHHIRKELDKMKKSSLIASTSTDKKSRRLWGDCMKKLQASGYEGMAPDEWKKALMACFQKHEGFRKEVAVQAPA